MSTDKQKFSYEALSHAMQSGVEFSKSNTETSKELEPKHIRVGINTLFVEFSALTMLLIEKGVITLEEFEDARKKIMIEEVERYEKRISDATGTSVTLL